MRRTPIALLLCTTTIAAATPRDDDAKPHRTSKASARKHHGGKHHRAEPETPRDDQDGNDDTAGRRHGERADERRDGDDATTRTGADRRDDARRTEQPRVARDADLDVHTDPAPAAEIDTVAPPKPRAERHPNELYIIAGAAHVDARVESGGLQLDAMGLAALAAMPGPIQGNVVSDPANIIAGMIGFAPGALHGYLAIETVIGIPETTKLRATGDLANKSLAPTALGLVPTGIPPLGSELGEAKAVPPMVTAIFRLPALGPLRFYAGGGASVLFVMDAKVTNKVLTEVATPTLDITPAVGAVGQIGVDIHLFDRFSARLDVKELWFTSSEATISNIKVHTTIPLLETVDVGSAKSEFKANPIIVQAGLGATF